MKIVIRGQEWPRLWWVPFMGMGLLMVAGIITMVVVWGGNTVSEADKSRFPVERGDVTMAQLNEAIRLNPDFTDAYIKRAKQRSAAGDFEGATADVDKALAMRPGDEVLLRLRAEIRSKSAGGMDTPGTATK